MTKDAPTTSTYPFPMIRLVCDKCGRKGQYRRQTLIDRFDPDTGMPGPPDLRQHLSGAMSGFEKQ